MAVGVWADDEEVYVNKELGILMTSKGYMVDDGRVTMVSTFVRVPNPLSEDDICELGCAEDAKILSSWLSRAECAEGSVDKKGKMSVMGTVIRVTKLGQEWPSLRAASEKCLLECLRERRCEAFGVEGESGNRVCKLRERILTDQETFSKTGCVEFSLKCLVGNNRTHACEEVLKEDKVNFLMVQEDRNFVQKHWRMVNSMMEDGGEVEKQKRDGLLGTVIGGAMGFLATGFSFKEVKQLKDHMNKFAGNYNEFKNRQLQFNREQVKFNENVLEIMERMEHHIKKELVSVQCKINNLGFYLLNTRRLLEWKSYLYQLYKDVLGGAAVGPISQVIFTKDNIRRIVSNTDLLRDTIYERNPSVAYRLGTMYIADKSECEEGFCVHVVIKLPIVKENDLKMVFNVQQVGVKQDGRCKKYQLPQTVYRDQGKFMALHPESCSTNQMTFLKMCIANVSREEMPCITDHSRCRAVLEECETRIAQSSGGLLVRAEEEIRIIRRRGPETYERVTSLPGEVIWLNSSHVKMIAVGEKTVKGWKNPVFEKTVDLQNSRKWLETLRNSTRHSFDQSFAEVEEIIGSQKKLFDGLKDWELKIVTNSWWLGPSLGLLVLGLAGYVVWRSGECKRIRRGKKGWEARRYKFRSSSNVSKVKKDRVITRKRKIISDCPTCFKSQTEELEMDSKEERGEKSLEVGQNQVLKKSGGKDSEEMEEDGGQVLLCPVCLNFCKIKSKKRRRTYENLKNFQLKEEKTVEENMGMKIISDNEEKEIETEIGETTRPEDVKEKEKKRESLLRTKKIYDIPRSQDAIKIYDVRYPGDSPKRVQSVDEEEK